ncbi:sugar ABC transporter ATP-binding protein [Gracilibacillus salinarum]|uniref:Sugar ABC transporter ATP-binding protein n=1 Tax=Gracilibacillus salinarum TaxID=2932255 RepID=A0ABY4GRG8_9BACI|nr:sugar ABC transporter ATP-binding protein [Gracilibacillus salinarum]UOQ86998.1 sugar ABC transporter ATP-binding protein [Gracilibacillus salinarum]
MESILKMEGIDKLFPGVKALSSVDLELFKGEVHALMGENGAGKSTLMKILSGVYTQTKGTFSIKGEEIRIKSPSDAARAGISMIHQEFNLFPNLSVAENIFMDRPSITGTLGVINWKQMNEKAQALIDSLGASIDVREKVQNLSVQSQQVVEIAKAISFDAEILIMDEPSAALPENEVRNMLEVVMRLKEQGVAIVYVSHRMPEVFEIADRVTVLRDGKKIATKRTKETTQDQIINMMVGREVAELYPNKTKIRSEEVVLDVQEMTLGPNQKVNFQVRKGEIVGLFGLMGAGTHNVAERLFGLKKGKGTIMINGKKANIKSPKQAKKQKIGYVPPDRHRHGLIKEMTVKHNLTLTILDQLTEYSKLNREKEQELITDYIQDFNIKTPSSKQVVNLLSGGNQQKIVLSKWLATNPDILILEEPTRGVDVGAKAEIYALIQKLADDGMAILFISTEMPEVIGMSDRILVMRKGEMIRQYNYREVEQNELLSVASSIEQDEVKVI